MEKSYLIDTQIFIWLAESPEKISTVGKSIIASDAKLFFSTASIWEMAIKVKTGKLVLEQQLEDFIDTAFSKHRIELLPVSVVAIYYTQQLELHHKDPFDRILVAQASVLNIPIVSSDEIFDQYPVERIWK